MKKLDHKVAVVTGASKGIGAGELVKPSLPVAACVNYIFEIVSFQPQSGIKHHGQNERF